MLKIFVWLHRWLGIVLCLLFAVWFASGAVLLFVPFPSLSAADARAHAEPLNLGAVRVSPGAALARLPGSCSLRLVSVLGRPVYVATTPKGDQAVSAITGAPSPLLASGQAAAIASHFAGAPARSVAGPLAYDQWIVHQGFDHARPMYRVGLRDPSATELYVSARTGEVLQKTRGYERAWNWLGAVVHWLYFVPLRRFFTAWDQTVWWVSLVGLAMTAVGIGLGLYRTTKKMRSKRPALSPYEGWLKWHHVLGLCGGAVVLTWIFSGWLSMDHGRLFSRASSPPARLAAYQGATLASTIKQADVVKLRRLGAVTSVRFNVVGGRLIVAGLGGRTTPPPVPPTLIDAALRSAWPGSRVVGPQTLGPDDFYGRAEGAAPDTQSYRLTGDDSARVFIDPRTGEIDAVVDRSRATYDWVYYALHSFNFPGLLALPLLRALIVLPLLALGFGLCVTSVVVGVRRLRIAAQT